MILLPLKLETSAVFHARLLINVSRARNRNTRQNKTAATTEKKPFAIRNSTSYLTNLLFSETRWQRVKRGNVTE